MGNCFSSKTPEEHDLESVIDVKNESSTLRNINDLSGHKSFPPGLERKTVKNKAPVVDKRVEGLFTRDAPDAIITQKDKTASDLSLIYNSLNKHFIFKNLSKEL